MLYSFQQGGLYYVYNLETDEQMAVGSTQDEADAYILMHQLENY